jgi:hypothetical protein
MDENAELNHSSVPLERDKGKLPLELGVRGALLAYLWRLVVVVACSL